MKKFHQDINPSIKKEIDKNGFCILDQNNAECKNIEQQEKVWVNPFNDFLNELSNVNERKGVVDDIDFLFPKDKIED